MASIELPPPLPPLPPPPGLPPGPRPPVPEQLSPPALINQPPGSQRSDAVTDVVVEADVAPASAASAAVPYLTIKGLKTKIDSGFDRYIEDSANAATLKEVPIKGENGITLSKPSQVNFTPIDGDFPKTEVTIFEHMVYHRNESMKLNPLEVFIPTKYKIDHNKINQF